MSQRYHRGKKKTPPANARKNDTNAELFALFGDDNTDEDVNKALIQQFARSQMYAKKREDIYRIPPHHYLHVLNQNTNVTRVVEGPITFICQDHEVVTTGVEKMITVPPRSYIVIANPAMRENKGDFADPAGTGAVTYDDNGMVLVRHGEKEVRLAQDPFPLYPGEKAGKIQKLQNIYKNKALRLRAKQDLVDRQGVQRYAGDEWLFEGPGTYIPHVDIEELGREKAQVIRENTALKLRAKRNTQDRQGVERVAGEEWLVKTVGAYLPGAYEEVVEKVNAAVLTDKVALHVEALKTFVDRFGQERKTGECWLLTNQLTETFIPSVNEKIVKKIPITTLTSRQYCVIMDPYDEKLGSNRYGEKRLVRGEFSFFLHPDEMLEAGIQRVHVLREEDGLVLSCEDQFEDDTGDEVVMRKSGERWIIRGPMEYVPPCEVCIVKGIKAIPLDQNEGVYVQDNRTGKIRAVVGETYMLTEDEELYEKELNPLLEHLLFTRQEFNKVPAHLLNMEVKEVNRDKTKVIQYRVPHNTACQIYDYATNTGRVVFGPSMVLLGPEEEFTPISLSGGKPKKPNQFQTLHQMLGPDFFQDLIIVETSDHARLQLEMSYNWYFKVDSENPEKLFSVSDFVGDACKAVASRVRGAVARVNFDDFHKNSAKLIRASVFGREGKEEFYFPANGLCITGIDVISVDPLDDKTKGALQKAVKIAIAITTQTQQAAAQQEADKVAEKAKGKLRMQELQDEADVENSKKKLEEIRCQTDAVKTTGLKVAEAKSRGEAELIACRADLEVAQLEAETITISAEAELMQLEAERGVELELKQNELNIQAEYAEQMAEIETKKFIDMVSCIGADTIKAMALAGPEMQAKLLGSLGIDSTLIMDGRSPINLFNTAAGLVGSERMGGSAMEDNVDANLI